mmetsp:Transcript_77121/g.223159  ORF Transcript_77121/g.223159 Transcript_77121/m.223159 type:complete len:400 (-) Transcript_77121:307-1506(-)
MPLAQTYTHFQEAPRPVKGRDSVVNDKHRAKTCWALDGACKGRIHEILWQQPQLMLVIGKGAHPNANVVLRFLRHHVRAFTKIKVEEPEGLPKWCGPRMAHENERVLLADTNKLDEGATKRASQRQDHMLDEAVHVQRCGARFAILKTERPAGGSIPQIRDLVHKHAREGAKLLQLPPTDGPCLRPRDAKPELPHAAWHGVHTFPEPTQPWGADAHTYVGHTVQRHPNKGRRLFTVSKNPACFRVQKVENVDAPGPKVLTQHADSGPAVDRHCRPREQHLDLRGSLAIADGGVAAALRNLDKRLHGANIGAVIRRIAALQEIADGAAARRVLNGLAVLVAHAGRVVATAVDAEHGVEDRAGADTTMIQQALLWKLIPRAHDRHVLGVAAGLQAELGLDL